MENVMDDPEDMEEEAQSEIDKVHIAYYTFRLKSPIKSLNFKLVIFYSWIMCYHRRHGRI